MAGSRASGVRILVHVLAGVDKFAREQDLTRSMAIVMLVEQALSESGVASSELPSPAEAAVSRWQAMASGQRAQQLGIRIARKIAAVLRAEKATN